MKRSRSALGRGPKLISKLDQFWKYLDQDHGFESDLDHSKDQDQWIDLDLLPKRSWSTNNPSMSLQKCTYSTKSIYTFPHLYQGYYK